MDQLRISVSRVEDAQNLSILLVNNVSMIYSDGSNYPIQLGTLALGGANINQTFTIPGKDSVNASLLPGSLLE